MIEVYYVTNPVSALGQPSHLRWAVAIDGSFHNSYEWKETAVTVARRLSAGRDNCEIRIGRREP